MNKFTVQADRATRNAIIGTIFMVALLGSVASVQAQEYRNAVGARLGYPVSASYKHFVNESHALEGYLGLRGFSSYNWINISGAYLVHRPIREVPNLQWYYGGGGALYFYEFDRRTDEIEYASTVLGLQGYLGLDYHFEDAPINLTLDWVPTIFLGGFAQGVAGGYGSLGVRYIISY